MRIGIFDPYLDDLGGGEKYMMTIAQCLSKDNLVDVFWDNKKDLEVLLKRFSLDLSRVNFVENIFSSEKSKIKRLLATKKYDVIIFLSDGSIPFVLSKKLFIHLQQPLQNIQSSKIKISKINKVFYNSEYSKTFNQGKINAPEVVIYPPVDFFPKKTIKQNIILNVGRFRVKDIRTIKNGVNVGAGDYKKQSVMIGAFKKMIDKGLKDWKFVLAISVKPEEKETFEKFRKDAKDYPIEFMINKSNKDLWDIYSKAKIYWHASGFGEDLDMHPELAEHFGISTVEAMGAGAVPIVINAGGQKEIVSDNVNGFMWNTIDELISKTLLVINNDKLMHKFSKEATKVTEMFNSKKFCKEISELIS